MILLSKNLFQSAWFERCTAMQNAPLFPNFSSNNFLLMSYVQLLLHRFYRLQSLCSDNLYRYQGKHHLANQNSKHCSKMIEKYGQSLGFQRVKTILTILLI